tara:strand:- start:356 stop:883 length:528 start_codon:yes stop_codon:yes gene_type:complete
MPRAAPANVVEQRITLGSYERERLDALLELANQDRTVDRTVDHVVDLAKAAMMPVGLFLAGYVVYQGMIHWATGVDGLRDRFNSTPFGQYTDRFGENIRRAHPVYRFINWGFGGENPPIVGNVDEKMQAKAEALLNKIKAKVDDVVPDVVPGSVPQPPDPRSNPPGDGRGGGGGF